MLRQPGLVWQNRTVDRARALAILKAHELELRDSGVMSAALFGSLARGQSSANDIDVAVRLDRNFSKPGLDYFSRMDQLERRLSEVLGCGVDVVEEPARKARLQEEIDRDRTIAF